MNGVAYNSNEILESSKTRTRINVASCVDEPLTDSNIVEGILSALDKGSAIYIPPGEYDFHCRIEKDCDILIDKSATITFSGRSTIFTFTNCSLTLRGGKFYSGENFPEDPEDITDDDRKYAWSDPSIEDSKYPMIEMSQMHDVLVENMEVLWSKHRYVLAVYNSTDVRISRCTLKNLLHCGMVFTDTCKNVKVDNCHIENIYYGLQNVRNSSGELVYEPEKYCYAATCSVSSLSLVDVVPTDNLIYENNYIYNSDDLGLDVHGATNVVIRNNVVLETGCSITAYNDCRRVKRPEGWIMTGILVENNYCESSKTASTYTDHCFTFYGSPNIYNAYDAEHNPTRPVRPGKFNDFTNCIVRNNYFKSSNGGTGGYLIAFNACSNNIVFDNNYVDGCDVESLRAIALSRCMNAQITNNIFKGFSSNSVPAQSVLYLRGNKGLSLSYGNTSMSCWYGECPSRGTASPAIKGGYTLYNNYQHYYYLAVHPGIRINPNISGIYNRWHTTTFTQTDGLCSVPKLSDGTYDQGFIEGLNLDITNQSTGTTYQAYVSKMIDFDHFEIRTRAQPIDSTVPDGNYTAITVDPYIFDPLATPNP